MIKPELIKKVIRFGCVGIVVMLCFMGLNWMLAPSLGKHPAFLVSYIPAVALHFLLNKYWTFGSDRTDSARQFSEYVFMVTLTFGIQWSVFALLENYTHLPSWFAAGVANVTQMCVSFLMMYRRVFTVGKLKVS